MNDCGDVEVAEDLSDQRSIGDVALDEGAPFDRRAVPRHEIVDDDRPETRRRKSLAGVAADVSRATRYEDVH
jgi:hypothetical protein